jgi:serine/threonine protein kinase
LTTGSVLRFSRPKGETFDATLGNVLAEGGGGVVQLARKLGDPSASGSLVVKRAKKGGEALLDYERHTCEQLDHPSLVRYFGSASAPDLGPVLAFEALAQNPLLLLNGESFRPDYRDPGTAYYPLPPNRAIELAFDLLLALEHLHEKGFVHADVKLSNLLTRVPGSLDGANLMRSVAQGNFTGVLIDLGSVRSKGVLNQLTLGQADPSLIPSITPHYAPPEALFEQGGLGGHKVFSTVMDTYSFGLVFYVLLTGRIPYNHIVSREALKSTETVLELKVRESRGEISPIDEGALARIPLHDVAFDGPPGSVWPQFHAAVKAILRRCLVPDPAKRMDTQVARAFFQEAFKLRPAGNGARAWTQSIFQMRPRSNRLLRDQPLGGLKIREDGNTVVCEESAPPAQSKLGRETLVKDADVTISYRSDRKRPTSVRINKVPPAPKGMVYLADVLREVKAKRPIPVTAPVIVTRTGFSSAELVQCLLFSLGQAREHVKISDASEVTKKRRVTVGRGEDNYIVVADASVSKHHLSFELESDGSWWVVDNGSSNGTFVDDAELSRNGRVRLSGGLATIGLGLTAKLTVMHQMDLDAYLERALDCWSQAFSAKARPSSGLFKAVSDATVAPRDEKEPGTEAFQSHADVDPRRTTRRQKRPDVNEPALPRAVNATPAGSLPRGVNATPPGAVPRVVTKEELPRQLAELDGKAYFEVHLDGARLEECETAAEVLELLATDTDAVLRVDAFPRSGGKTILYRKPAS